MCALDARTADAYLRAFADDPGLGAAIMVAIASGLRRSELLAVRWGDCNLDEGTIRVVRAIERVTVNDAEDPQNKSIKVHFKQPKTATSRREVVLPTFAVERLRRHAREQKERFDRLGIRRTNDSLVFDREGEALCPNTFGLWFTRLVKRNCLPRVRLHDLRYSFSAISLEAGVDLQTLSRWLGHSSIRTTIDLYGHISQALQRSAAERLDRVISAAASAASDGTILELRDQSVTSKRILRGDLRLNDGREGGSRIRVPSLRLALTRATRCDSCESDFHQIATQCDSGRLGAVDCAELFRVADHA